MSELAKLLRQFNRRFEAERETLSVEAQRAGHGIKSHLTSLEGGGIRSAALRAEAVSAIDAFEQLRRGQPWKTYRSAKCN